MTTKKESTSKQKSRVKVKKLQLNKETVKNLTGEESQEIKGGGVTIFETVTCGNDCQIRISRQCALGN